MASVHPDRLHFSRHAERRTSDDKLLDQLEFIALSALDNGTGRGRGWTYEIGGIAASDSGLDWTFRSWIKFYRDRPASPIPERAKRLESEQREVIYQFAAAAGHHSRFGRNPWIADLKVAQKEEGKEKVNVDAWGHMIADLDPDLKRGLVAEQSPSIDPIADQDPIPLSSISSIEPGDYYSHLFGLDPQIRILLSAIQAAADSDMRNRFHSLLHGRPGAGKTDILLSTHKLLTSLGISCLSIDATSTTEAGMRKLLLDEDEILPEVILVEEIEKALHSFRLLLGIMDDRGTVSQMNYRKTSSRKVPALILASANDYALLQKIDSGALLSRFSNEIECPLPDREICAKILEREINLVKNGNLAWIEPTLIFCCDERGIFDPRQLKRICLSGKDRLLTGEYQLDLEVTMRGKKNCSVDGIGNANLDLFKVV